MEGLQRLVSESFARYGVETAFDHRRLQWSQWFRCADSFGLVQLSSKPGLFALADPASVLSEAGDSKSKPGRKSEARKSTTGKKRQTWLS